jgi:O-antigen ligase
MAAPVPFLPGEFFHRLMNAPYNRGTGRLDIFLVGLQVIKHHPVVGAGLNNFTVAYTRFAGYAPVFRGFGRAAHNAYLQVWGETGIVGLCLFLAAIWSQMSHARRHLTRSAASDYLPFGVEAACYGILIDCLAGNIHWEKTFWLAFILLALVTAEAVQPKGQRCAKLSMEAEDPVLVA